MAEDIQILVVDDTVTYRQILSKLVGEIKDTQLVGTASNGKIAMSKIKIKDVDLVLLDMYMPVMNGLETLQTIKKEHPHIEVIMLSAFEKANANLTMQALENGALDFITKPSEDSVEKNIAKLRSALIPLMSLVKTRKFSRKARTLSLTQSKSEPTKIPNRIPTKPITESKTQTIVSDKTIPRKLPHFRQQSRTVNTIDAVALGVSTGGPNALLKIIPFLDKDFPVPILAVQHMPPMFTASLAERLDKQSKIQICEAADGQRIEAGVMYIAPGGRHMVVKKNVGGCHINLIDSPPVNSCRPAVDVLFRSILNVYGGNVLTVIMTGMGNDGAAGVSAIRRKGGYSIIQDEASSVVWGMPGAVAKSDNADETIALDKMAARIQELIKKGGTR
ncbi:MAG: Chemotaxis response regulator protein-glutamate methylesterase [Candidatus Magnetoglobus multicellularis str. Araruama]|uniref:Protein-glutamate methylesterase/protein-glutamine glutaminase n=1 Tax=Candidatus Magnetoglobus multicellularis str. Araruama TaxID=890399 RepID=A0A1V1P969_9BACT|nr:MAG: Chemotaxis response regulator protein-glutamate methylesterase [Candidatus Magnetoglobus multicellularis str. Araruama]